MGRVNRLKSDKVRVRIPGPAPQLKLKVGDIYEIPGGHAGEWEVLRVSELSAVVRPLTTTHRVIKNDDGSVKAEFDSPGAAIHVSPYSLVKLVRNKFRDSSNGRPHGR